tara:strand:+ start:806 stop:979 length:174 start_codon:yes stop_codon:yes gene_type:complete
MKHKHIYELVYKDGMTHSSFNYSLIKEIWSKDKDKVLEVRVRDLKNSKGKGFNNEGI